MLSIFYESSRFDLMSSPDVLLRASEYSMKSFLRPLSQKAAGAAGDATGPAFEERAPPPTPEFVISSAALFVRRNLITILLSIEIMLNAVNLTFVAFGRALGAVDGQIIVFFVMTVAAAEAAVGLAIVIDLFRHRESLNPDSFTTLKW